MLSLSRSFNVCKVVHRRSHSLWGSVDKVESPTSIEKQVMQFLSDDCKVSANSFILLSVSGGLDSMALLHILSSISRKHMPLNLEIVSFNHKLREESDEEVNWCMRCHGYSFASRLSSICTAIIEMNSDSYSMTDESAINL